METLAVDKWIQIGNDAVRTIETLSDPLKVVAICYIIGTIVFKVCRNGWSKWRKLLILGGLPMVFGPFFNWALWVASVSGAGEIDPAIRNLWIPKLVYGILWGSLAIAFHQSIGQFTLDKLIFRGSKESSSWIDGGDTIIQTKDDVAKPGDGTRD